MDFDSALIFDSYVKGDDDAAKKIYDKYLLRLIALVQKRLSSRLTRRLDPEDVIQSAYRSFFRKARDGDFTLQRSGDLWRLLAGITIKKTLKRVEKERAARRNPSREECDVAVRETIEGDPSPEADIILIEQVEQFMNGLSSRDRRIVELRLQDENTEVIAKDVNVSEATVRRTLRQAYQELESELLNG